MPTGEINGKAIKFTKKLILCDSIAVDYYCRSECTTPQSQCPLCPLRKVQDATILKHRDNMTTEEAINKVQKTADSTYCQIKKNYDNSNQFKLNED